MQEFNQYPIMHLIGSTHGQNQRIFDEAERCYTDRGYIVFKPVFFGLEKNDPRIKMLTDMCTQKLCMCDVVCVVTKHIGESTRARIEQAKALNKKIIFYDGGDIND